MTEFSVEDVKLKHELSVRSIYEDGIGITLEFLKQGSPDKARKVLSVVQATIEDADVQQKEYEKELGFLE